MSASPSWRLEDADPLARAYPYTFYKPSPALIAKLEPGDLVKLIFAFDSDDPEAPRAERMWVLITERDGNRFAGTLDNDPLHIQDLVAGTRVEFAPCHIISSNVDDPVPDPTLRYDPRCYVTSRILSDGARVGYMYREAPDGDDDSGWRFVAGDETDEYMDDADNSHYVSLGAVLRCDDSWVELMDTPAPCAFARDLETDGFEAVEPPDTENDEVGGNA